MNCNDVLACLDSAADNELPSSEAAILQGHLNSCSACKSDWDKIIDVRQGIKSILEDNRPKADFEKRIIDKLNTESRNKPNKIFRLSMLAAAIFALILFTGSILNVPKPSLQISSAVSVENLLASVDHHSNGPQDKNIKVEYLGNKDTAEISKIAGFNLSGIKMDDFKLEGSDIIRVPQNKVLVRMCFTSDNYSHCIDCYQAPQGMLSFENSTTSILDGKEVKTYTSKGQTALMLNKNGIDILYVGSLPKSELMKLIQTNV